MKPGNYMLLAKIFSAFIDDKYNEVLFEFNLDTPLTQKRYHLNKIVLQRLINVDQLPS